MFGLGLGWIAVIIIGAVVSGLANLWVRRAYSKFSKQESRTGMTGAQMARSILDRNGLQSVNIEPVAGQLTDHYDPRSKVIRLSEDNFNKGSIAGVSVAAHECGHAIQDAQGYVPLKLRSGIFPAVNFSNQLFLPLIIGGIFLGGALGPLLIKLAALALGVVLIFHLVTLPVEINASTRAHAQLTRYGLLSRDEAGGTRRVLTAAAFTYIAVAFTTLLMVVFLLLASR